MTDAEKLQKHALGLELIGVSFESVDYGRTELSGYIDPDPEGYRNFRVPPEGFDPLKGSTKCPRCKGKNAHPIVEYQAPEDPKLFSKLRGRKIRIFIGAPFPQGEEGE